MEVVVIPGLATLAAVGGMNVNDVGEEAIRVVVHGDFDDIREAAEFGM
jgi:hypothetical protein